MTRTRGADPKHFILLLLVAALAIGLAFGAIGVVIQKAGGNPLPGWPPQLARFAAFVWIWKITGMYTALRLHGRLGLRWLL